MGMKWSRKMLGGSLEVAQLFCPHPPGFRFAQTTASAINIVLEDFVEDKARAKR